GRRAEQQPQIAEVISAGIRGTHEKRIVRDDVHAHGSSSLDDAMTGVQRKGVRRIERRVRPDDAVLHNCSTKSAYGRAHSARAVSGKDRVMDERMAIIDMHRSSTCPGSIPSKENLGENQIALINENAASFIGSAVPGYAHLGERTVGARHAGRSASRSRGVAGKSAARD